MGPMGFDAARAPHVTPSLHPVSIWLVIQFTCRHRRLTMNAMLHAHQP
jgi:hypothetical protein